MTRVWFVAVCCDCEPPLPMPFLAVDERDKWAQAHRDMTGHRVETGFEIDK